MPSDDIRAWGRANGFDVGDEGRLPTGLRAAFDGRTRNDETAVDADSEDTDNAERAPAVVKPTAVDRVRGLAARAKPKPVMRGGRKTVKPRISTEKAISWLWSGAAALVNNMNPAVARVMYMQAPVAGMVLEEKVKNTVADKLLQPIARGFDGGNTAIALLGPPLIVQALTMRPERAPQLIPMLRVSLKAWIDIAGDRVEKEMEENEEFEKKYGKKIDEMMQYLVGDMFQFVAPPVVDGE